MLNAILAFVAMVIGIPGAVVHFVHGRYDHAGVYAILVLMGAVLGLLYLRDYRRAKRASRLKA